MKRKALTFTLIVATLILTSFTSYIIKGAKAGNNDYTIQNVNHTVEVLYNGYVFINDTMQIDGRANGFLIGFPYKYGSHVLECVAYDGTADFQVDLNVTLEDHVGFYSVRINFPQGTPEVFTVGFVLSNNLLDQNPYNNSQYVLDFPAYPSLTKDVANCNVSILLPEHSQYIGGTVDNLVYRQENLTAFTYSPADLAFSVSGNTLGIANIKELNRQIKVSGTCEIEGSDTYSITSKALQEISSFQIILPQNATDISAYDQLGRTMNANATEKTSKCEVFFTPQLRTNRSVSFTVKYSLPGDKYIKQGELNSFNLTFTLLEHLNYYVNQSSVTFVLPEGARMLSFEEASVDGSYSITRNVFQETLTVNRKSVFSFDSFNIWLTYEYNRLWLSFRPTLWMWSLAVVGCALALVWKRPKAPIAVAVSKEGVALSSKDIRSFVDAYDKRRKIILEAESLKTAVRKGKIPRRRYKVRRRTLETRFNALSRNLADLREKLLAAGGRHRDLMRRLEVAEIEITEVDSNIESIEARHRRGELSLGGYRKLLADYERRKDKAETAVNEILIRLREELH